MLLPETVVCGMKAQDLVSVFDLQRSKISALLQNPRIKTADDSFDVGLKAECVNIYTGNIVSDILTGAYYTDLVPAVRVTFDDNSTIILPKLGYIISASLCVVLPESGLACFGGKTIVNVEPSGKMRFIAVCVPAQGNIKINGIFIKTDIRRK